MNQRPQGNRPVPLPTEQEVRDAHVMAQAERLQKSIREGKQFGDSTPFDCDPIGAGWILCHLIEHPASEGGIVFPEFIAKQFVHYKAVRVGPPALNALGHEKPRTVTDIGQEFCIQGNALAYVHRGVSLYFVQQDAVLCGLKSRTVQP